MIKESRYILRRILIGVGIVLVLGFLRSYKVNALSWSDSDMEEIVPSFKVRASDTNSYKIYFNSTENRYYLYSTKAPTDYSKYIENASDFPYIVSNMGKDSSPFVGANGYSNGAVFFYDKIPYYLWPGDLTPTPSDTSVRFMVSAESVVHAKLFNIRNDNYNFSSNTVESFTYNKQNISQWNNMNINKMNNLLKNSIIFSNIDIYNYVSGDLYYQKNVNWSPVPQLPRILSLQQDYVLLNNVIIGFKFAPKFDIFDLSTYSYQYKLGHDSPWVSLSQNEQELNFNQNGNLYFRIIKNSDLSVVYNLNYTITSIGENPPDTIYDINFSYGYDTGASGSSQNNIILKEYVDIDYIPNASNLKYQYQFVVAGNSIDNDNWTTLPLSANAHYHFETNVVGSVYARILDSEDNVLLSPRTFYFASIGKIAINNNNSSQSNFFSNLSRRLNFGGPISGIITLPIRLAQTISTGITSGSQCSPFPLGSLWGTNLLLPCVNVKQYLGNSLYTTIDLICACVMIYYILKMFGEMYAGLLFMQKNPIQDLGRRGD